MQSENPLIYRFQRLLLFICAATVLAAGKVFATDGNEQKKPTDGSALRKPSGVPYCGLFCIYTVMKLADRKIDFRELVKYDYLSSKLGSSFSELKKASEDYGLYAIHVGNMTSRELFQLEYPVILHVKLDTMSVRYDHFELFLGEENGKARIFDPPNPVRLVSFAELAPRWNGKGLIVSVEPIDLRVLFAPTRKRFVLYAVAVVTAILVIHWVKRWFPEELLNTRFRLFGLSIGHGVAFALAALLCGILYNFVNESGLLANANATNAIQQAHAGNFIPKINEKKVRKLLSSDAVIIDARLARDYKAGHLDGAISVPVDANDVERRKVTTNIPKNARIVLYCQSAMCKFAEIVAIKLQNDGYSNISIFKGGWVEWVAKNGKPKEAES
jgi:rhodanese-related sulfurtransferase